MCGLGVVDIFPNRLEDEPLTLPANFRNLKDWLCDFENPLAIGRSRALRHGYESILWIQRHIASIEGYKIYDQAFL